MCLAFDCLVNNHSTSYNINALSLIFDCLINNHSILYNINALRLIFNCLISNHLISFNTNALYLVFNCLINNHSTFFNTNALCSIFDCFNNNHPIFFNTKTLYLVFYYYSNNFILQSFIATAGRLVMNYFSKGPFLFLKGPCLYFCLHLGPSLVTRLTKAIHNVYLKPHASSSGSGKAFLGTTLSKRDKDSTPFSWVCDFKDPHSSIVTERSKSMFSGVTYRHSRHFT